MFGGIVDHRYLIFFFL